MALQQACINLDKAFQRFFDPQDRAGYPRFKSKRGRQSSYHCVGVSAGDNWVKVPKLGPLKAKVHRLAEGRLKSITLSRTVTGKYHADTDEAVPAPLTTLNTSKVLGLDVGLTHLLIDSNGAKTNNPRFLRRAEANFRRKQKVLSRCRKGSSNRAKARLKLAKAHERVANARNDFQHKLSHTIIGDNQAVIVETLKVKNMLKNGKLAKHIADAAWHSLLTKLEYKAKAQGRHLARIDQWFASSKTCHVCGYRAESMPLGVRAWQCADCGTHHDRDINAALNIKQQGILKLKAEGLFVSAHRGLRKSGVSPVAA